MSAVPLLLDRTTLLPVIEVTPVPPNAMLTGAVMSMFNEPEPLVKVSVPPLEVREPKLGSPDDEPISTWPFVPAAVTLIPLDPSPSNTPKLVRTVRPVPPFGTGRTPENTLPVLVIVIVVVPSPVIVIPLPAVKVPAIGTPSPSEVTI